jgi:putative transposase
MKKMVSYKFRVKLTPEQEKLFRVESGHSRFAWNYLLTMYNEAYATDKTPFNSAALSKHINAMKKTEEYSWLNDATATVITQKIIDLDKAFKNFFKKGSGYPKFKKKDNEQRVRYQLDQRVVVNYYRTGELLRLPNIGVIDVNWHRIPKGIPKMVTLIKAASGEYYVSFSCEEEIEHLPKTGKSVGLDVGIKDVIVSSDGYFSGAPQFYYQYQRDLKLAQRALSRKTKGSNRYENQRIVVAKLHALIARCRKDFLHKLSKKIVTEYDCICIEDLNVKGMVKNRKLSKAVSDVGMYELRRQLTYKADWYGKEVRVISRWFPSTKMCSSCGMLHDMKLSDRMMNCDCGFSMNRDLNAAINIKQAGMV